MADIFLSYSRADRDRAEKIAKALEAEGFSVWWDKVLRAGQTYDEVTEGMLRDSRVVVVLWSEVSVKSKWVRAEATLGQRTSTLVPAMIDDVERPIMFELTQSADLIGWSDDRADARWQQFIADLRTALGDTPTTETATKEQAGAGDSTIENTFWTTIKDGTDPSEFEAYLKRYPDGHFADLARSRLNNLKPDPAPVTAVNAPSPAPATPEPQPSTAQPPMMAEAKKPEPAEKPAKPAPAKKKGGFPFIRIALVLVALGAGGFYAQDYFLTQTDATPPTTCALCPEMVVIPGGSFTMGSSDDEAGHREYEGPQRTVTVASFTLGRHEVTFDEWALCVEDGGCSDYTPPDRGFGRDGMAAMSLSFNDAQAYLSWLSQKTGRPYRLPSEAEWEYAARGGTETAYWWGDRFSTDYVKVGEPKPVLSLAENPYGLKGILGNLREWVEDCYVNSYEDAPTNGTAQTRQGCEYRVLRGGAYNSDWNDHRAANRARSNPGTRDRSYGFRVASSLTDTP